MSHYRLPEHRNFQTRLRFRIRLSQEERRRHHDATEQPVCTLPYLPDFIVLVDDGHGPEDLLHLVVEIKGYRREDAIEKKSTMDTYWVPGVNHLGTYGRWAFAEFTEVYQIEADFKDKVKTEFDKMVGIYADRPGLE